MSDTLESLSYESQVSFGRNLAWLELHPLRFRERGVLTFEAVYAAALADWNLDCHHPFPLRRVLSSSAWECGVCRVAFARVALGVEGEQEPGSP